MIVKKFVLITVVSDGTELFILFRIYGDLGNG